MKTLVLTIVATAALAAGCESRTLNPPLASTVTFQLHNDGASTTYVAENCLIVFTITSLADPAHQIALTGPCACECGQSPCPVCGPCRGGPVEVVVGGVVSESWTTVDVTTEPSINGSCERRTALPPGPYRIDVPVYSTGDPSSAASYTASQTFTLPVRGSLVDVALGASP